MMAAVPMARFVNVIDSRTIVVDHAGTSEVVRLTNVDVPTDDEQAARAYLAEKLTGTFVYVENGNVYRSPDALFINRELAFGAYSAQSVKVQVFGQLSPGSRSHAAPRPTPARKPAPMPRPRPATRARIPAARK
jgi:hypothetical protein